MVGETTRTPVENHAEWRAKVEDYIDEGDRGVPWELIKDRFSDEIGIGEDRKPLILLCDEAQNLDTNSIATRTFLDSLHSGDPDENDPLPLVPVLAGLADTEDILTGTGISRGSGGNFVPLGGLSTREAEKYALGVLAYLDAEGSQTRMAAWAKWAAKDCDGWPHHLRTQMDAIAREMLRQDTSTLGDLDGERIARDASKARNYYYTRRLAATGARGDRPLFERLARIADDSGGISYRDMRSMVEAYAADEGRTMDADAILKQAIEAGILQPVSALDLDRHHCPIPSLTRWLDGNEHVVAPPP